MSYNYDAWDDIVFKFQRGTFEDDFNDQLLIVKDKRKFGGAHELSSTLKVNEASNGSHKVALEEKLLIDSKMLGGHGQEIKLKNDGSVAYKHRFAGLRVSRAFTFTTNFSQSAECQWT